jgi:ATP synthase protein I
VIEERPPLMTTADMARTPLAPLVRAAILPGLLVGGASAVVAGLAWGSAGLWGVLVATVLVTGFFTFGQLVLHAVRWLDPGALFLIAMLTYLMQVVVLLAVFASFRKNPALGDAVSAKAVGVTVIVMAVTWSIGLMAAARRERIPVFDVEVGRR